MQRILPSAFLGIYLLLVPLSVVEAAEVPSGQEHLLHQIEQLRSELSRLQILLARLRNEAGGYTPYQSVLFTRPVEATYQVRSGKLIGAPGKPVRAIDAALFDVCTETLGAAAMATYVAEWRVYHDTAGSIDAYVEQIAETDRYVVNVNRAGFDISSRSDQSALKELFLHEYAHMLLIPHSSVQREFASAFWTASDLRAAAGTISEQNRYFKTNRDRFVSEYALQSVDEDMAETFLYAVVHPETLSSQVKRDKYDFLYDLPWVRAEIIRLQDHLN